MTNKQTHIVFVGASLVFRWCSVGSPLVHRWCSVGVPLVFILMVHIDRLNEKF